MNKVAPSVPQVDVLKFILYVPFPEIILVTSARKILVFPSPQHLSDPVPAKTALNV